MSSPRLSPSSIITSTSAQQAGHQVTLVLPLRTTSRFSVSMVILVVFTTMAPSYPLLTPAAASIGCILGEAEAESLQSAAQNFSKSFNGGVETTKKRTYDGTGTVKCAVQRS